MDACGCGKRRYMSRREAKLAARRQREKGRLNAYPCGDFWHLGHLPEPVRRGRLTRADLVKKTAS